MQLDAHGALLLADHGLATMSAVLRTLHKERRHDRIAHLRSIDHDAQFVAAAHSALGCPPLLANLRCGVWYAPPNISTGHCYFKSTDGHAGCWDFSLSRLNLQVALAAAQAPSAVMLVDSTRSGKRFPDALSKTVPIWCCVVNRAVALERGDDASSWDTALHLPPWVPPSEASQVEARLSGWVEALRRPALGPVLARLAETLRAPLRPGWLCPTYSAGPTQDGADRNGGGVSGGGATAAAARLVASRYAAAATATSNAAGQASGGAAFVWVHCVCASEVCTAEKARERASFTYIQGAGDDEENWSRGLTAEAWWRWRAELMELAARDPEGAEELLSERLAALRASNAAPPVGAPSIQGQGAGTATDIADRGAHGADGPAEGARGTGTGTGGAGSGAPWGREGTAPCALWGSGLLLGPRYAAAAPGVWAYADAILDVGSALSATTAGNGNGNELLGASATSQAATHVVDDGVEPAAASSAGAVGAVGVVEGAADGIAAAALPSMLHVAVEDEGAGRSKRAQPSKDYWQRVVLPRSLRYLAAHLARGHRVLICCERGDDRSATVAVAALLALYAPDASTLRVAPEELPPVPRPPATKEEVRARLALLQGAYPPARISRQLTKELNNYFVAERGGWRTLDLEPCD